MAAREMREWLAAWSSARGTVCSPETWVQKLAESGPHPQVVAEARNAPLPTFADGNVSVRTRSSPVRVSEEEGVGVGEMGWSGTVVLLDFDVGHVGPGAVADEDGAC